MYKNLTANDYKKILSLSLDYKVDSTIIYGTWNFELQENLLNHVINKNNFICIQKRLSGFLSNIIEITFENKTIWFIVAYGGTMLSEYLHLACLFGSQKNIFLGSCGGLQPENNTFDFVIPTKSYGNESSTRMYQDSLDYKYPASPDLIKLIDAKIPKKYKRILGETTTCQAMLAETWEDIQSWSNEGYLGVEMESSTVFAVSNHFMVPAATLLYISDNLIHQETVFNEHKQELKEEIKSLQYQIASEIAFEDHQLS